MLENIEGEKVLYECIRVGIHIYLQKYLFQFSAMVINFQFLSFIPKYVSTFEEWSTLCNV